LPEASSNLSGELANRLLPVLEAILIGRFSLYSFLDRLFGQPFCKFTLIEQNYVPYSIYFSLNCFFISPHL
jgi:hypothetical protein